MIRICYGSAAVIVVWTTTLWLAHLSLNHPAMVLVPLPQAPAPVIERVRVVKCAEPVKITAPLPKSAAVGRQSETPVIEQWTIVDGGRRPIEILPQRHVVFVEEKK